MKPQKRGNGSKGRSAGNEGRIFGTGIGRQQSRPDRRAVIGSVTFHAVVILGVVASGFFQRRSLPEFEVYTVHLVSPPPQVAAAEPEPVVQRPPPVVTPETETTTKPTPPAPIRQTPRAVEEKPPEEKKPEPAKGPDPKPDSPGGENIDVNMEGRQEFPFPEYLDNVILQMSRYFRWTGEPTLKARVVFYIDRDGNAGGISVIESSGNLLFNLKAMEAVERASRGGAFGPLPDGWAQDRLWIRFRFLPPGSGSL